MQFPGCGRKTHLHRVSAVTAKGKHPVPFRTRKLSSSAPMVLRGGPRGRVGRRRTCHEEGRSPTGSSGPLRYVWTLPFTYLTELALAAGPSRLPSDGAYQGA